MCTQYLSMVTVRLQYSVRVKLYNRSFCKGSRICWRWLDQIRSDQWILISTSLDVLCCFFFVFSQWPLSASQTEAAAAAADKGGTSVTSDNAHLPTIEETSEHTIPKSDSDTFLTTPDGEDEDKIINTDTGLEGDGLTNRTPKKDLLEIDRFTICGNRIDWGPREQTDKQSMSWKHSNSSGIKHGSWNMLRHMDLFLGTWPKYLFIYSGENQLRHKAVTTSIRSPPQMCSAASGIFQLAVSHVMLIVANRRNTHWWRVYAAGTVHNGRRSVCVRCWEGVERRAVLMWDQKHNQRVELVFRSNRKHIFYFFKKTFFNSKVWKTTFQNQFLRTLSDRFLKKNQQI